VTDDREKPLVHRIGGKSKRLEGEGTEQRRRADRSGCEERRSLPAAESYTNFSEWVHHALAARELRPPVIDGTKLQARHDVGGQERIQRASVDKKVQVDGSVAMVGMYQGHRDGERAHA
jgi:hypothetical protein